MKTLIKLKKDTTIEEFINNLSEKAKNELFDLTGERNVKTIETENFGSVEVYLDACSEGADRGGFVTFVKLHQVKGPDGQPVVLEAEPGGDEWLFENRMTTI